ncbi:hypothetical protein JTE90_024579 [Oedothorax gibbosus]|uniref:Methylosome protein 50 n=1 Tax=Oedothorax gibbosus TaxID=931172 RepID=A0AAV6VBW3_9ARAC|nr:hypothetical protein JTE90_024579 [Oedothorax gibbosus]
MTSIIPAVVENHLDAIHCASDGKVILTSSNLTGRYWNGSLWCFANFKDAPDVEKCLTGIDVSSGICDLEALGNDFYALGLDSGGLEVYKLSTDPDNFTWTFGICEHDDYISSISLNSDKTHIVSAGADRCIKIWDVSSWSTTATYTPVHDGIIWQVACSVDDSNVFVTCGQDGKVLLFDLRLPKPASVIDTSFLKGAPTAVCWNPKSSSTFFVGDDSGVIALKDMKNTGFLSSTHVHKRRVHRMCFSKSRSMLASCADDVDVAVMSYEKEDPTPEYQSTEHEDFVRGLSWTEENDLVSCGWDKKVIRHAF